MPAVVNGKIQGEASKDLRDDILKRVKLATQKQTQQDSCLGVDQGVPYVEFHVVSGTGSLPIVNIADARIDLKVPCDTFFIASVKANYPTWLSFQPVGVFQDQGALPDITGEEQWFPFPGTDSYAILPVNGSVDTSVIKFKKKVSTIYINAYNGIGAGAYNICIGCTNDLVRLEGKNNG
jgi:hypothetical protein